MRRSGLVIATILAAVVACTLALADKNEDVSRALPAPRTEGGMPLMEALKARRTQRAFDTRMLSDQVLADLLWAAFGINREDSGKRTAPSAVNWQEIDIYVATAEGLFLYDAKANTLHLTLAEDIRAQTDRQPFVAVAPVTLIYVADYSKMGRRASEQNKTFYSACDTGFIGQNAYLFCASEGLSTVVRGLVDRDPLKLIMGLRTDQHIMFCQTVGFPQ